MSLFWFGLLTLVLGYVLMSSKYGNWIQAAAATRRPPPPRCAGGATKISLFILTAVVAPTGSDEFHPRDAANPDSGDGYELMVIAMTVIGGTVLTGGKGTIIGTVIGVLLLRVTRNGIVMAGDWRWLTGFHRRHHLGMIPAPYTNQRQRAM